MRKLFLSAFVFILLCLCLTGCGKSVSSESKNIKINIYNKDSKLIYSKSLNTDKNKLFYAINSIDDLEISYEDSEYGKFITSINGIEQGNDYYWNYYINSKYATSGISSCNLENNAIYDFRLEKFE